MADTSKTQRLALDGEQSRLICDITGKRNNMDLGILGSSVLLKSELLGKTPEMV